MRNSHKYYLSCFALITLVDYTTAFNPDWQRWVAHMPAVWIFYLTYPLLFTWLIFKRRCRGWRLALVVLTAALLLEIVVFNNPLFDAFPLNLLMIPLAFAIYAFITYIPLWLVEGSLRRYAGRTLLLTLVWMLISLLTYFSTA